MTVRYLHLGGTVFFDEPIGRGPMSSGRWRHAVQPEHLATASEFKPSLNLGLGYPLPLTQSARCARRRVASSRSSTARAGFLCSGGCVVVLSSDVFDFSTRHGRPDGALLKGAGAIARTGASRGYAVPVRSTSSAAALRVQNSRFRPSGPKALAAKH
jgi:hypothetical protein